MNEPSLTVQHAVRRLSRRLSIGLFLDAWPAWAVPAVLSAGLVVLVCRLFVPGASRYLPWLWLAPVIAALPACFVRRYQPSEVVALADSLAGGHGLLLTLHVPGDAAWAASPLAEQWSVFTLPRLRPWRRLAPLVPALAFLAAVLWLPQRARAESSSAALADEIAADLQATLAQLKEQALVTPAEEKALRRRFSGFARHRGASMLHPGKLPMPCANGRLDLSAKQDALT